jgi:hypothetical protein
MINMIITPGVKNGAAFDFGPPMELRALTPAKANKSHTTTISVM